MTSEEIALIRSTFAAAAKQPDATAALFYAKLFTLDPSLRGLFHGDMRAMGEKFISMLAMVAANLSHLDRLLPTVRQLGERHAGYRVQDAHYVTVGAALLAALAENLGPAWSPAAHTAWSKAYDLLSSTMIEAAHQAAQKKAS
ncbi:hemin receptor [Nibricoccus aquaticus]|uniref:Hemin receptor n=1 Tax=Nibricoccus aquaticus TaxID=2576891 RepID=A0A290QBJ0_9BACT|nr:hemin receptor [Nibricoccus aquaticus]